MQKWFVSPHDCSSMWPQMCAASETVVGTVRVIKALFVIAGADGRLVLRCDAAGRPWPKHACGARRSCSYYTLNPRYCNPHKSITKTECNLKREIWVQRWVSIIGIALAFLISPLVYHILCEYRNITLILKFSVFKWSTLGQSHIIMDSESAQSELTVTVF